MNHLPASTGWQWIKEGFALFRKQPAELSTLFFGYMLLMLGIGVIPVLGQILPLLLIPVFSMVFMQACANIEAGQRVSPTLLVAAFRSPALGKLLRLGTLYLLAIIGAVAASSVIDGGIFWQAMTGQITPDQETVQQTGMKSAMLFAAVLYLPAAMAFWYAAPLIIWQRMGIIQALFYSFFSVWRAMKAFIVYGIAWILAGVVLPVMVSTLLVLLTGKPGVTMLVLLPLSLLMTIILYCSFYPTYTYLFGKPAHTPPA